MENPNGVMDRSWFAEKKSEFEKFMGSLGYSPTVLHSKILYVARFEDYVCRLKRPEAVKNIESLAVEFAGRAIRKGSSISIKYDLRRFCDFVLGRPYRILHHDSKEEKRSDYSELLQSYCDWCRKRLNRESTINGKRDTIMRMFRCCQKPAAGMMDSDWLKEGQDFIVSNPQSHDYSPIVRDFLLFLYQSQRIVHNISLLIPEETRHKPFPSVYSKDELRLVQDKFDTGTITGNRNLFYFLLASELCMRAGDIVGLRLENIDLEAKRVNFVTQKTETEMSLPMTDGLVCSINDYLSATADIRKGDSHVFLRSRAPYTAPTSGDVTFAISEAFRKSGIDSKGRKRGPHALRMSLASGMVNSSVPYDAVRKVLGHSAKDAIRHYARIDIENLRFCALEPLPFTGKAAEIFGGQER